MQRPERDLWLAWMGEHPTEFERVAYNVRVGLGIPAGQSNDKPLEERWRQLTRLRIDAVCQAGPRVVAVEVKLRMTVVALGQMIGYRDLLNSELRRDDVAAWFVCSSVHPDIAREMTRYGIRYFHVVGASS
jgi:hypothetical protein